MIQYAKNLAMELWLDLLDLGEFSLEFFIIAFTGRGIDTPTQISFLILISLVIMNTFHHGSEAYVRAKARNDQESEV